MRSRHLTIVLMLALGLLTGCGGSSDDTGSTSPETTSTQADSTTEPGTTTSTTQDQGGNAGGNASGGNLADGKADIYFTSGEQFRKVERDIPDAPLQAQLTAATKALLAGPTEDEAATKVPTVSQIPADTKLVSVGVGEEGAVVDVSPEFTAGVPDATGTRDRAERSDIDARLAQVTYTLTQFPGVKSVKVVAGGEPVESSPAPEEPSAAPTASQRRTAYTKPDQGPQRITRAKGQSGSSVKALQTRLADLKYLPKSAVDGVNGYRTQQAILAFQSWRGLDRDGVVGPATQAALDKASPPRPHAKGAPSKRIEVYREKGVILLIKNNRTKRAIHVSTGGPGNETPSGTYKIFRKELQSWSVPFQVYLPYASYFNAGIAFHEYPDVPTYPASHGCVRVPAPEAPGVYKFAALDTTVIVY